MKKMFLALAVVAFGLTLGLTACTGGEEKPAPTTTKPVTTAKPTTPATSTVKPAASPTKAAPGAPVATPAAKK